MNKQTERILSKAHCSSTVLMKSKTAFSDGRGVGYTITACFKALFVCLLELPYTWDPSVHNGEKPGTCIGNQLTECSA
jgi:hypothetical protein